MPRRPVGNEDSIFKRLAVTTAVVASVLGTAVALNAPQATADSRKGCSYPYVCFYLKKSDWDSNRPTAMFQDKGYWQNLGANSRGAYGVINTRNDDAALIRHASGYQSCAGANGGINGYSSDPWVKIKIIDTEWCPG